MAPKSTIWPIYVLGVICFGVSAAMATLFVVTEGFPTTWAQHLAIGLPLFAGLAAFRAGLDERRRLATGAPRAVRSFRWRRATPPPLAPAPRLGDDPFRDPPGTPPIVTERHAAPIHAPIVPGDPADRPKLLT